MLKAIRKYLPKVETAAWARRPEVVEELSGITGLVDQASTDPVAVVAASDLVILAMPTRHMAPVVERIDRFAAGAIVTDVGSVKGPVMQLVGPAVRERGGPTAAT